MCDTCWPVGLEEDALGHLRSVGVHRLGITPSRYFGDFKKVTLRQVRGLKSRFFGFSIDRLLGVFPSYAGIFSQVGGCGFRSNYLHGMDLAVGLGAQYLVCGGPFGEPLSVTSAHFVHAVSAFDFLGWEAERRGLVIGVSSSGLGGGFLEIDAEVVRLVVAVGASSIRWHADTGVLGQGGLKRMWLVRCGGLHIREPGCFSRWGTWLGHVGTASYFKGSGHIPFLERHPGKDPLRELRAGLEFVKGLYV